MNHTKYGIFSARMVSQDEPFSQGHRACQGCAPALVLRLLAKTIGRNLIVVNATGCMEIIASPYPHMAWEIPWLHVAFENAAAVASGVEAGIKVLRRKNRFFNDGPKPTIVAVGGDGGTMDIGLQALSGALERGHDFLYVCYDNEAYMNTGIQRSSGTPLGASTTTSPAGAASTGQATSKKDFSEICAAHNIPYVATANVAFPFDFMEKVKKATSTPGAAVIHIFAPCPTGWRCPASASIRLARLATETGMFPLYEVENGKYTMDLSFEKMRDEEKGKALKEFTDYMYDATRKTDPGPQGRYRHARAMEDLLAEIQRRGMERYNRIKAKAMMNQE